MRQILALAVLGCLCLMPNLSTDDETIGGGGEGEPDSPDSTEVEPSTAPAESDEPTGEDDASEDDGGDGDDTGDESEDGPGEE